MERYIIFSDTPGKKYTCGGFAERGRNNEGIVVYAGKCIGFNQIMQVDVIRDIKKGSKRWN
ncbi:MAG: hypothetical protein HFI38_06385 [Lachnospiraceae bacterium]|jgi:hypothetical protein|nr:hypothetical protein [Lachnospiraceae bacterium]